MSKPCELCGATRAVATLSTPKPLGLEIFTKWLLYSEHELYSHPCGSVYVFHVCKKCKECCNKLKWLGLINEYTNRAMRVLWTNSHNMGCVSCRRTSQYRILQKMAFVLRIQCALLWSLWTSRLLYIPYMRRMQRKMEDKSMSAHGFSY